MLKFESEDKDLLVWIKGVTKSPENLTQQDLEILQDNGDIRVVEAAADAEVATKKK